MSKTAVKSDLAPQPIGPYSQAIRVGDLLFCSGQIAIDPTTGELVTGGVETQTHQAIENIAHVLAAAGTTWRHVVKTTIFLTDLSDFTVVNRVYGERVGPVPPARSTVQVAALPKGASVEIDVIAHLGASI